MTLPLLRKLLGQLGLKKKPCKSRSRRPRRPLELERLEDRLAPAVNNWLGAVSGNWNDAALWSDGTPTADDDVVIAAVGPAYTINVNINATVSSIAVGSSDATLRVLATGTTARSLTVSNGATNSGALLFDNATGGTGAATLTVTNGALTNTAAGVITAQNTGGTHGIAGNLINDGSVNVNDNASLSKTNGVFTNNNQFNVGATGAVSFGTTGTFTQAAGNLDNQGTFTLAGDTFNFNGGTITGNAILLNGSSALNIGAGSSGAGSFVFRGASNTYSGDLAAGQTIRVQANVSTSAAVSAAGDFTNHGTIILENLTGASGVATFTVTSGTLTNAATGVITTQNTTGTHAIAADLHNQGTVNINDNTSLSKTSGVYTNSGQWTIAAVQSMGTTGIFTQAAGNLDVQGSFNLSSDTFNFNGGTLTGNAVDLNSGALNFGTGAGPGSADVIGAVTLSGDVAAGFTLLIDNFGATTVTAATGFINHGTIILDGTSTSLFTTLTVTSGTLTNAADGVIISDPGTGGRKILADIVNEGAVYINASTRFDKVDFNFTNNGSVVIAPDAALEFHTTNGVFTQADGTLDVQGTFSMRDDTFNYNGGTLTGNAVKLRSGTLNLGPGASAGSAQVTAFVTLSGDIPAGFTFFINNDSTTTVTAATGFTNHGVIILDGGVPGASADLVVTTGTLTNAADGIISVDPGAGGRRLIAELDNLGAVHINTGLSLGRAGANHTNAGTMTLVAGTTLTVTGASLTNAASGMIEGVGRLIVNGVAFTNHGTLSPGFSAGVLPITGALLQGGSGKLKIELGGVTPGAEFDQLTVSGNANLTGSIDISLINGFVPVFGQSFRVMNYGSRTGTFAAINGRHIAPGLVLLPLYSATHLDLVVGAAPVIADADMHLSANPIFENGSVTLNGSFNTFDLADAHTVTINWGDGSALTTINLAAGTLTFNAAHQYLDDNPSGTTADDYAISVTVEDDDGDSATAGASLTVNNSRPIAAVAGAPVSAAEGTLVSLTGSFSDVGTQDTHVLSWNVVRDGTSVATGAGADFDFTAANDGDYVVTFTVTDDDGGIGSSEKTIHVTNGAPTASMAGAPDTSPEGTPIHLIGSATDPGVDDTITLTWTVTKDGDAFASGSGNDFTFTPDDDGAYVVVLTATDDAGDFGTDSATILVTNMAPSVAISGAPDDSAEGAPIDLSALVTDPGSADTHSFVWSVARDGNAFASGNGAAFSFTPDDDGAYEVIVTATDDDGDTANDTKFITVTNAAPAADAGPDQMVNAGDPVTLTGSFTDPGAADTHSFTWHVVAGNGQVIADGDSGDFSFTPSAAGDYTITFTVADDDGAAGYDSVLVTVLDVHQDNAAPEIVSVSTSAACCGAAESGETVTFSATFTDLNAGDTHTATINWGDGASTAGVVVESGGIGSIAGSHVYASGGVFTITVTVLDNPGATDVGTITATVSGVGLNADGQLQIIGTCGRDLIHVNQNGDTIRVHTKLNHQAGDGDCDDENDEDVEDPHASHRSYEFAAADVSSLLILGCAGNDHVKVGSSVTIAATIDGGAGNDHLRGGAGDDTIIDMLGNNRIRAGRGNDTVTTGAGDDRIWTDGGNDVVHAGDGNNRIHAGIGNDLIVTGAGNDYVWTDGGADTIYVGDGANVVHAGGGNNVIFAGAGNDDIWSRGGDDFISAGDGHNDIRSGDGNDTIITGAGNDRIWSDGGDDTIDAGDGCNDIRSGSGSDTITSGSGRDAIDAGAGDDLVRTGDGNDSIQGGSGDDILVGGAGDDLLIGGEGRDLLIGGTGADRLSGNADEDILIAGYTAHDANDLALFALMNEWASGNSYATRTSNIQSGDGSTPGYRLDGNDGILQTVFNDTSVDTLTGHQGRDWFFANQCADNGGPLDIVTDKAANELWQDTDF